MNYKKYRKKRRLLRLTVLVTSIWDSVVELVFEDLNDWQLTGRQSEIYGITMDFNDHGAVIWTTAHSTDVAFMKEANYVISRHMKWRFMEDNRPAEYR